ncbi:MAG: hypothetical protein ISQ08_09075 [Planctomycetes bacterium]|nr:hypothetical protein [Planctomycetota bacterium]
MSPLLLTPLLLSGLLLPSPAPGAPASLPPRAAVQGPADELGDLKEILDPSLRWLRGRQDRTNGSYGDLETTAWVLRAFAESPRGYRRTDGAFVRDAVAWLVDQQAEDGGFGAADLPAATRARATQLACAALQPLLDAETREAFAAGLGFLGRAGIDDPYAGLPRPVEGVEEARVRTLRLLAARLPDQSWEGSPTTTARHVVELSAYRARLRPEGSTPEGARPLPAWSPEDAARADEAVLRGARFLLGAAVAKGQWGSPQGPDAGITAMALGALQAVPRPRPQDVQTALDAGLDWLRSLQHEDGSIHAGMLANYVTSAAVMALSREGRPGDAEVVARAQAYLVELQADEGEGYSEGDLYHGGIGYGGDERPDLSNLQMALDALAASGLREDHEAWTRAVRFLERCQNRSESNDVALVDGEVVIRSGEDGGAGYAPGDSKAGFELETRDGETVKVPRSYGSMTYALFKCYVLAGLDREDPRVQAAWKWLGDHWTLDLNPGFELSRDPTAPYQGLFYYYQSMARALEVSGEEQIVDAEGTAHAWRQELAARLVSLQSRVDGSWINENAPRWWEGNPVLATSYALSTLGSCRPR